MKFASKKLVAGRVGRTDTLLRLYNCCELLYYWRSSSFSHSYWLTCLVEKNGNLVYFEVMKMFESAQSTLNLSPQTDKAHIFPNAVPIQKPIQEPIQKPIEEPIKEPLKEPIQKPIEEPFKEPLKEPLEEPLKEPIQQTIEETIKEIEETIEEVIQDTVKTSIEENPIEEKNVGIPIEPEPVEGSAVQPVGTTETTPTVTEPHEGNLPTNQISEFKQSEDSKGLFQEAEIRPDLSILHEMD